MNDVVCGGIEHKLGLHGSPTCTMLYGSGGEGAVGWMIGEPNRGLQAMFLMMNRARVTVGLQGVGVAERAYQQAVDYARERRQGRPIGKKGDMVPIIEHPDIERHLMGMKAKIAATRAICYACAEAEDRSRAGTSEEKSLWQERVALLTPVAKAFSTDLALEVTQSAVQVHGGAGYIEETGVAQYYRDARVFAIYEGTNGIQGMDLVMRKLPLAQGGAITRFGAWLDGEYRPGRHLQRSGLRPDGGNTQGSAQRSDRSDQASPRAADRGQIQRRTGGCDALSGACRLPHRRHV